MSKWIRFNRKKANERMVRLGLRYRELAAASELSLGVCHNAMSGKTESPDFSTISKIAKGLKFKDPMELVIVQKGVFEHA